MRGLPDDVVAVRRTGGDGAATSGEQTVVGARERVLEAALVVLRDVGYGQFSVQKVAREAGVYQGNITYYWPRRRDLVLALAVRIVDDYRAAFVAGFHGIDVPVTTKAQYSLMDVDSETGFLSLLTDSGDCKEDVGLMKNEEDGSFDELGQEVISKFDAGESLKLTVLSLLGRDVVVACDVDTGA